MLGNRVPRDRPLQDGDEDSDVDGLEQDRATWSGDGSLSPWVSLPLPLTWAAHQILGLGSRHWKQRVHLKRTEAC
eukprot:3584446-Pyramimonas_sp.AAC.1